MEIASLFYDIADIIVGVIHNITDLIPISREEVYLKYIAENGTSRNYDKSLKGIIERTATNVDIPNGVTTLGNNAVNNCKALIEITFQSKMTKPKY